MNHKENKQQGQLQPTKQILNIVFGHWCYSPTLLDCNVDKESFFKHSVSDKRSAHLL